MSRLELLIVGSLLVLCLAKAWSVFGAPAVVEPPMTPIDVSELKQDCSPLWTKDVHAR